MPKLWIAQLLCPKRHAICALAYDLERTPADEITQHLQSVVSNRVGGIDPWCGLCGSRELHVEHGKLFTDDWDEAETMLRQCEEDNVATREFFHRSKN